MATIINLLNGNTGEAYEVHVVRQRKMTCATIANTLFSMEIHAHLAFGECLQRWTTHVQLVTRWV